MFLDLLMHIDRVDGLRSCRIYKGIVVVVGISYQCGRYGLLSSCLKIFEK